MKKISFIIPVYNCAEYLAQCVKSIQEVNVDCYEIILVNDGSTDNSGYVCEQLSNTYNTIKYVCQKNQGVSAARNLGLSVAAGDFVIFLDADDMIEPQKFFQLFQKLEKKSDIDIAIFGHSFDYYHDKRLYRRDEMQMPLIGVNGSNLWIQKIWELYSTNSLNPIWNKVFKRSFLIDNKLYFRRDMFLYEDLEYSLRCIAHCENILFEPDIIYHYRQSESTVLRLKRISHIPIIIREIEKAFDNLLIAKQEVEKRNVTEKIVVTLYLILAREKISVSNLKEIGTVCDDFAVWFCDRNYQEIRSEQAFIDTLLKHRVANLVVRRYYTALRHKIAVKVKNSAFYKKRIN